MIKIILTCSGRSVTLINQFKEIKDLYVIAADSNKFSPTSITANEFLHLVPFNEKSYKNQIIEFCKKNSVDIIMSLYPEELKVLETIREVLKKNHTFLIGLDLEILKICENKQKYSFITSKSSLELIDSWEIDNYEGIKNENFPIIIKEKKGKGSKNQILINTKNELNSFIKNWPKSKIKSLYFIQKFINGIEYGLDVINDLEGNFVTVLARQKIYMRDGETEVCKTVNNKFFYKIGEEIGTIVKHQGLIDCDLIKHKNKFYLLDINIRFGGGYIFSHIAGANIPCSIISWFKNEKPKSNWLKQKEDIISSRYTNITKLDDNKSIIIITESDSKIGMGHLERCIAISRNFEKLNYKITFLVSSEISALRLTNSNLNYIKVDLNNKNDIEELVNKIRPYYVIIDLYYEKLKNFKFLEKSSNVALIVSLLKSEIDYFGKKAFLIGKNINHWRVENKASISSTMIYSGRAYIPFREEFSKLKKFKPIKNKLLICHGGSDPAKLTELSLKLLESINTKLKIDVLIGSGFDNQRISQIKKLTKYSSHNINLVVKKEEVADLMASSSVAIINGGNLRYELCLTKTPFIAISYQRTQDVYTKELTDKGIGLFLGYYKELDVKKFTQALNNLLNNTKQKNDMRNLMSNYFDKESSHNIVNELING